MAVFDETDTYQGPSPCKIFLHLLANALYLYPTVETVVEHNVAKLHDLGQPITIIYTIKAVHMGVNAAKASPRMQVDWKQLFALLSQLG